MRFQSLVYVAVFAVFLAGCASDTTRFGPESDLVNAMDAIKRVSPDQARTLVVATMTDDVYRTLRSVRAGRSPPTDIPGSLQDFFADLEHQYGLKPVADWPLSSLGVRCLVFESTHGQSSETLAQALIDDPRIESAQALKTFETMAGYDDPYFELQHALQSMQVIKAHRWATGKGITVAVVDTGMDTEHPEFDGRIRLWRDFVDQDGWAFRSDRHGTAVGGVIAANANNGIGMVGVAPDAQLVALRACIEDGPSRGKGLCTTFTLAKSIDYAIANNVDVINLSLSGPADPLLERLVGAGLRRGITVVGAVHGEMTVQFPAHIEGVIAVGQPQGRYDSALEKSSIRAPGRRVLSTSPGTAFDFYSGSSLSAAHVSGLIALLKERKPHISTAEIASLLQSSATRLRSTTASVDACRAVATLVGVDECS